MAGAGMAAGGAMSGMGGIIGAMITASATKSAARKQANAMKEIFKWGYGYPDWLIKAIHENVDRALESRMTMSPAEERQLRELGPEAYEQYQSIDRLAEAWDTTNKEQTYKDIAKGGFGTGARALEELGLEGGALERAQQGMGSSLAQALMGAGERGEQQQRQSVLQQAALHQGAAGMLPSIGGLYQLPGQVQMGYEAHNQGILSQALATATGIPGYQYQPPQIPQTGQFMGPAIAGAASSLGQAWAYNQGMNQQPQQPQYYQQQPQYAPNYPAGSYGGYERQQQQQTYM